MQGAVDILGHGLNAIKRAARHFRNGGTMDEAVAIINDTSSAPRRPVEADPQVEEATRGSNTLDDMKAEPEERAVRNTQYKPEEALADQLDIADLPKGTPASARPVLTDNSFRQITSGLTDGQSQAVQDLIESQGRRMDLERLTESSQGC